ncbi:MAG: fructosamine kinase family protein [Clostridia bacterium]|nr:fructosamine kinase family protein [Clostridia bacterium]
MKILDNSNKHLSLILPDIILKKLNKKVAEFKFIGGGSYGKVYKVLLSDGGIIAVKAYKLQEMQKEEERQLGVLSENTSVKMPEVLFTYEDDDTAILAMTFVEGHNVLNPLFLLKSRKVKQKFTGDVVSGMLEWHSMTNNKFGFLSNPVYDSWYDFYKTEMQQPWLCGLEKLCDKGNFSRKKLNLLKEASKIFDCVCPEDSTPVLIHGDLNIMNIMADTKSFNLIAFIDPCGSMWADREYDLFQFRNMWGDAYRLYETYKHKCSLSEYADFRVAYYGAMLEASMRLKGGYIVPLWEDLNFIRLKKEMKKLKEKM